MKLLFPSTTLSLLAAVMLAVSPAAAADIPDRGPISFEAYDQNHDGTVSEAEFDGVRAERMQKRAEQGYPMRRAGEAPLFSEFDGDGDGKLTRQELQAGQLKQLQERRAQRGGMGGGGRGPGGGMGAGR